MDNKERIDLKRLMAQHSDDYQDNTEGIRRLRHSSLIIAEVAKMENIKKTSKGSMPSESLLMKCQTECSFLYNKYTDIFNRLYKDELDLELLANMLATLKKIEDGDLNQQEGSVIIGKILHKIYVDSAMRRGNNVDKEHENEESAEPQPETNHGKTMSYKEFKQMKK